MNPRPLEVLFLTLFGASVACTFVVLLHAARAPHAVTPDPALPAGLALCPHEDLRHPSWGRLEHGRLSHPGLVDPRLGALLVRPLAFRIAETP